MKNELRVHKNGTLYNELTIEIYWYAKFLYIYGKYFTVEDSIDCFLCDEPCTVNLGAENTNNIL